MNSYVQKTGERGEIVELGAKMQSNEVMFNIASKLWVAKFIVVRKSMLCGWALATNKHGSTRIRVG